MSLMEQILLKGCIISPVINVWSATKVFNPKKIGLKEENINKNLVSAGSMNLIPRDALKRIHAIRGKVRQEIEANSYKFDFGAFVPNDRIEPLKTVLEELKAEFASEVSSIKEKYLELRQRMLNQWQIEAVKITSQSADSQTVFDVMNKIELCFPPEFPEAKFSFAWQEHRDINNVAKEFIRSSISGVVEKMKDFAGRLRERIENQDLSERNLKPIRDFVSNLQSGLMVFESEDLKNMIDDMQMLTEPGTAEEIADSVHISNAIKAKLQGIESIADSLVQEMADKAIEKLTSHKRKIEV